MQSDNVQFDIRSFPDQYEIYDIFTDGSEIKEKGTYKTLGLGWAYVIKKNKETIHFENGSLQEGNNQRVELFAIFKALEFLVNTSNNMYHKDIVIHSDSDYSIKSLTVWSLNWRRNNWMTSKKQPVKHTDIIKPCIEMIAQLNSQHHTLVFNHVRSHTSKQDFVHLGNNEADQLANKASKSNLQKCRS